MAVALCWNGEAGEFAECGVDIGECGGCVSFVAICTLARGVDEQWDAGGLVPECELLPVLFFADVKTVIAPEYDDGVLFHGRVVEAIEEAAELVVDIADAGEVTAHEVLPLFVFLYPFVPVGTAVVVSVVEVIGAMFGEFDF